MGSFLEKYNGSEWGDVASEVIYYLKLCRKLLAKQENIINKEDIARQIKEINKLIKDFLEE